VAILPLHSNTLFNIMPYGKHIGKGGYMEAFKQIKWENTIEGQEVYIAGTHLGAFRAYGPHTVVSKKERTLKNKSGMIFFQCDECLMIKGEANVG
jgi:hypothetical protein